LRGGDLPLHRFDKSMAHADLHKGEGYVLFYASPGIELESQLR
jgi:hypothetical protein